MNCTAGIKREGFYGLSQRMNAGSHSLNARVGSTTVAKYKKNNSDFICKTDFADVLYRCLPYSDANALDDIDPSIPIPY